MKKVLGLLILGLICVFSINAAPGNIDSTFQTRIEQSGIISRMAVQPDGKIIIVGNFGKFNETNRNGLARLNADGTLDPTFNPSGANGAIRRILLQPDGKILVGGNFTEFNGTTRREIVRLNADGSLDESFAAVPNEIQGSGGVFSMALQTDGKIIIGGQYLVNSGSFQHINLLRLNSDGSLDDSFRDTSSIAFQTVPTNICLQTDGKVLLSFNMNPFGRKLFRLNADGSSDNGFVTDQTNNNIFDIKVQPDGKILIAGDFENFLTSGGQVVRRGVARFNSDGSLDLSFDFNLGELFSATVYSLALEADGKVLIAGSNSRNLDTGFGFVAKLDPNGSFDTGFGNNSYLNKWVSSVISLPNGKILLGGAFTRISPTAGSSTVFYRNGVARIEANGSYDSSFDPGTGAILSEGNNASTIKAMKVQADGKIIIGGKFNLVNGRGRPNFARLNADGTLDESFNPLYEISSTGSMPNNEVLSFAVQPDGKIMIGGFVESYGGQSARNLVRFLSNGEIDTSFQLSPNSNIFPYALGVQTDGKIIAAGFDSFGKIVRLNADGSLDTSFNIGLGANSWIYSLLIQPDGKILIGGDFTTFNGSSRQRIARLNPNGTFDFDFLSGTSASNSIYSIALQTDGKILLGGAFTLVRGESRNGIVRLNGDGSLDTSFNPGNGFIGGAVKSIAVQTDGKIIAGGGFGSYNGIAANSVTRINPNASLDPTFNVGTSINSGATIYAVAMQNDKSVLGGDFSTFNGQNKSRLVRLQNSNGGHSPFDFDGDGKTDVSVYRPSAGEWWYLKSSNGGNAALRFGVATDKPVCGDFTGDGKTDIAFWRPATGEWFVLRSEDSSFFSFPFGLNGDIPASADYDGDGKTDPTVFRPSTGTWYISRSADNGTTIVNFGANGDKPVAADYDGDGKTDIAVFRPNNGSWWYLRSSDSQVRIFNFGVSTDKPVQGDYTGDGKSDIAVFRPSTGEWFVQRSEDNSYYSVPFGANGDLPAPGDYDGDGRFDAAVFRPSSGTWYLNQTTSGISILNFGITGDFPVPGSFVP